MKQIFLITLIWIASISVSFSQGGKPFFVDTRTDSVSGVIGDKEYTIKYVVKKYGVGRYVTLNNKEPDHSNPSYCLWTVSVPALNFEAMLKIGTQIWMAENLAYNTGSGCWAYDNNSSNVAK